jgi:hypothetical protein
MNQININRLVCNITEAICVRNVDKVEHILKNLNDTERGQSFLYEGNHVGFLEFGLILACKRNNDEIIDLIGRLLATQRHHSPNNPNNLQTNENDSNKRMRMMSD